MNQGNFSRLKKSYLLLWILVLTTIQNSWAQTFTSSGGAIPDVGRAVFSIPVNNLLQHQLTKGYGLLKVKVDLEHTYLENLKLSLMSPDGTVMRLCTHVGGSANNLTETVFNQFATTAIAGTLLAPYTGEYRPEQNLGNFNNLQTGKGDWKLIIDDVALYDSGKLNYWSVSFDYQVHEPDTFSSNLPIVSLSTYDEQIQNGIFKPATMRIMYNTQKDRNALNDTLLNYIGNIDIQFRGMYSSTLPQLSYGLTTLNANREDTSVSLMGMPPENDWILMSTYNDKSFVRNTLMYHLFEKMGHYATRSRHCELYLNGDYQGVYIFTEKIRRTENRLNLSKLKESDTVGNELTGGYIFQHDYITNLGWNSTVGSPECPTNVANFKYEYPSFKNIQPAQAIYLQNYVAEIERRIFSAEFKDSIRGYRPYLDEASFADYFICNEFAWNGDGFAKSMFFYKDKNSKDSTLHAGPIWDFDWSLKRMPWVYTDLAGWSHTTYPCNNLQATLPWHFILMQDTFFQNTTRCRWDAFRKSFLNSTYINRYIDSMGVVLAEAEKRHYIKWPIWGINVGSTELPPFAQNYKEETDTLKALIARRIAWLDKNIPGECKYESIIVDASEGHVMEQPEYLSENTEEPEDASHHSLELRVFPNPAKEMLCIQSADTNLALVKVVNMSGRVMYEKQMNGIQKLDLILKVNGWENGVYLVMAYGSEGMKSKKIMVLRD